MGHEKGKDGGMDAGRLGKKRVVYYNRQGKLEEKEGRNWRKFTHFMHSGISTYSRLSVKAVECMGEGFGGGGVGGECGETWQSISRRVE